MIFARALRHSLRYALETNDRVILLGEDIADPYGGAFKITQGLSTDFPERVRTTPISEAAITGIASGLALAGYRPIVEIMFGDFLGLCFDQIINHISKYEAMYNGGVTCPVIIRSPSGGGRGYGPTHSQSLEKHFIGIPHLRTVAASLYHDTRQVFDALLKQTSPVLYVEHKLLYPLHVFDRDDKRLGIATVNYVGSPGEMPTLSIDLVPREQSVATVVAYGYQAEVARRVIERLALESELFAELLVPAQIAPLDWKPIEESVAATGALVVVEEGTARWSWGSEIAAEIGSRLFGSLRHPITLVSSRADVIPSSRELEAEVLISEDRIEQALRAVAR
jgi:pyruvate/2-oxoglutarate/acetoin dehydrogenase E1 component